MLRIALLVLLLTACASASPQEPTAAPAPEPSATASADEGAPSTLSTEEAAPRPTGFLCAHDRCPAVPPGCPAGQIPSVIGGEGGCYGDCVPIDRCACDANDDCPAHLGATCAPSGFCHVD